MFSLPAVLQKLINTKPTHSSYCGVTHSNPNRPHSLPKMMLYSLHSSGILCRRNHKWHRNHPCPVTMTSTLKKYVEKLVILQDMSSVKCPE